MASASAMQHALSHNSHESPLSTLVRRASSRRVQQPPPLLQAPAITFQYDDTPNNDDPSQYQHDNSQFKPPHSPLLHGHFARDSYATASSYENSSLFDSSASGTSSRVQSFSSANPYRDSEIAYRYQYDTPYDESAYSGQDMNSAAPALRDSWASTVTTSTVQARGAPATIDGHSGQALQAGDRSTYAWADDFGEEYYGDGTSSTSTPMVVPTSSAASAAPIPVQSQPYTQPGYDSDPSSRSPGRTPVTKQSSANFSRPRPPPPPQNSEEQKQQVLQRNLNRQRSQSPSSAFQGKPLGLRNQFQNDGNNGGQQPPRPPQTQQEVRSTSPSSAVYSNSTYAAASSRSLSAQPPPQPQPPPMSNYTNSQHSTSRSSLSPRDALFSQSSGQHTGSSQQPQRPTAPPRVESSYSLYSNYSYYPYESPVPSPIGSTFSNPSGGKKGTNGNLAVPPPGNPHQTSHSPLSSSLSVNSSSTSADRKGSKTKTPVEPSSALDFLLLGIEHHEADRLNESARCFERSATESGGCGVGMLMWGLTLRHGWGCPKNEKQAFKWLQRAAENAVGDLEATRARGIKDTSVVRNELVLAIYEVGQCFFQGWGVPKDQKMAFSYYKIAAELGDADAQMDLAFCLTNGKGCKKDKKEAARWYRAAVKQGQSDVGLAWIYKDKYQ